MALRWEGREERKGDTCLGEEIHLLGQGGGGARRRGVAAGVAGGEAAGGPILHLCGEQSRFR